MHESKILSRRTNLAMRNINLSSFGSVYARFVDYVFFIAAAVAVLAFLRVQLSHADYWNGSEFGFIAKIIQ